ncbi:hypothetical protein [Morganella morganii]|uniref:hypothetical protein n=1 Tax=Morganella morganii TaxID=582 RepID=UPI000468A6C6|nr:hypothetical protein [Morganella morganii]
MTKKRRSKTAQSFMGMNIGQAVQMDKSEKQNYENARQFTKQYEVSPDTVQMPLNRSMRRYAKKMKINIEEV